MDREQKALAVGTGLGAFAGIAAALILSETDCTTSIQQQTAVCTQKPNVPAALGIGALAFIAGTLASFHS